MDTAIENKVQADQIKNRPDVQVGDRVKMHMWIREGSKQRIQVFEGNVIAMSGTGLNRTVTVRKISYGVGVEKIVPLHSPELEKVEVIKRGKARSSKLYFIRERVGRLAMRVAGHKDVYMTDEEAKEAVSEDSVVAVETTEPELAAPEVEEGAETESTENTETKDEPASEEAPKADDSKE